MSRRAAGPHRQCDGAHAEQRARHREEADDRLLHRQHALSDRFIAHMLSRNVRIEQDLIDQLFNSSEKRLARALLLLARYGQPDEPPAYRAKDFPGNAVGDGRHHPRRASNFFMHKFRKLGFIDYDGNLDAGVRVNSSLLSVILHD